MGILSTIGDSIVGGVAGYAGASVQQRNNKELMDYQATLNREQWERETEYNSPANQMARMAAAGMNPNLALGDAGNAGNTQLSTGMASATNPFGQGASVMAAVRQGRMFDAQEDLYRAQAEELRSRIPGNDMKPSVMQSQIDMAASNIERNGVLNGYTQEQQSKIKEEIKQVAEEIKKTQQETANLVVQGEILSEQKYQEEVESFYAEDMQKARLGELRSKIGLNRAQANYVNQLAETEVEMRAEKIRAIQLSNETESKKQELIQNQIDAMQTSVLEGLCAKKNIILDENGNKTVTDGYFRAHTAMKVVDWTTSQVGNILHVNLSRTNSHFQGETQSTNTSRREGTSSSHTYQDYNGVHTNQTYTPYVE